MFRASVALLVCGLAAGGAIRSGKVPAASSRGAAYELLREIGGVSADDLLALERGEVVARVVDTDRRQVAIVGAVRLRVPRDEIARRYRDVRNLARGRMALHTGAFSDPPRAGDLASLAFEQYDLDSIGECEPGDCPVRLSGPMMAAFRQDVDWTAPDWRDQVARRWRDLLFEYVVDYRARGQQALPTYHNKEQRLRVADEFEILFRDCEPIARVAPGFIRYIRDYPKTNLPGTSDVLYWSKDDFGIRPVLSVTHLTTYLPPGSRSAFLASQQIYATHYFDAGLGLTLLLDDTDGGSYLVSVHRVRTRSLTSFLRTFVRSTVQSRSRERLEETLRWLRDAAQR